MKLIYRGNQEKMIAELATKLDYSPTDLVYRLIKDLHELIIKEPVDAPDARGVIDAREKDKEQDS